MNSREQFESQCDIAKDLMNSIRSNSVCPAWSNAPDWAQWLAQDATGRRWWYAAQPHIESTIQGWRNPWGTRVQEAGKSEAPDAWFDTLEQRP